MPKCDNLSLLAPAVSSPPANKTQEAQETLETPLVGWSVEKALERLVSGKKSPPYVLYIIQVLSARLLMYLSIPAH